jgi:hypothetical protein
MRGPVNALLHRLSPNDRKVIVLTFEIFWIAVFLLEAATTSGGGGDVAAFVYANF